ncbi:MAG: AMP-binding protein, partial [bacterium]|nr:AMP-binding protein [bacterium]
GPTEASDDITHYIFDNVAYLERIPIGKPVQNINIYIIDQNMQLCPIGIKGQICVSGVAVGRGYLNDGEKTANAFIIDPFEGQGSNRLYKTGDIGRWNSHGTIDFFGRMDQQVKIRGFRIESGEIASRLLHFETIKEAAVTDRQDARGNKYLCAYLVGVGKGLDIPGIKTFLEKQLPDYMIPSYFVELEQLPLTPNGKLDRSGLPEPEITNLSTITYLTTEEIAGIVTEPSKKKHKPGVVHTNGEQLKHHIISKEEREKILFSFNATQTPYPEDKMLVELFEEQVQKSPNRIALVFEEKQITYGHLNERKDCLALRLRYHGVNRESIVGFIVERSLEMITGMLGIMKAGGAYLPIGLEYPAEKRKFMLKDSGSKIVLVNGREDLLGYPAKIININDETIYKKSTTGESPQKVKGPSDLAYIMYTSGTTGRPKGVMIRHKNVVRLLFNRQFPFQFDRTDVWTMFHSYCFDFSVWEMYGALLYRGKLVLIHKMTARDPQLYFDI